MEITQIEDLLDSLFNDNTNGDITPADARDVLGAILTYIKEERTNRLRGTGKFFRFMTAAQLAADPDGGNCLEAFPTNRLCLNEPCFVELHPTLGYRVTVRPVWDPQGPLQVFRTGDFVPGDFSPASWEGDAEAGAGVRDFTQDPAGYNYKAGEFRRGYVADATERQFFLRTANGAAASPTSKIGNADWEHVNATDVPAVVFPPIFQRISLSWAASMDDDFAATAGRRYGVEFGGGKVVELMGLENGRLPTDGWLNGEEVRCNVHNGYVEPTGPEQVSWTNLMARFADTPPLPDKLYGITDRPSGDPAVLCRFDDVSNWAPGGVTVGMLVAISARMVGSRRVVNYDLSADDTTESPIAYLASTGTSTTQTMHQLAISNAIQAALNTAPLFVARRDDGSIDTTFTTLRDAIFWANGNAYNGVGGYVIMNRPLKVLPNKNGLLGQGTVLDLQNQPLDLGGSRLDLYAGAIVKNNRLIYNGTINLRAGSTPGTSIQGGVIAARIIGEVDYYGTVPLTLDNVIVTDYGQGGTSTNATAKVVLKNGSSFYKWAPHPSASVVVENEPDQLPPIPLTLWGFDINLRVSLTGATEWVKAGTPTGPVADVVVWTHQSNDSGLSNRNDLAPLDVAEIDANTQVFTLDKVTGALVPYRLGSIDPGTGYPVGATDKAITRELLPAFDNGFGPDVYFVLGWLRDPANAGKKLFIFKKDLLHPHASTNGASIAAWLDGTNNFPPIYTAFLAEWNQQQTALQALGYSAGAARLWVDGGGEQDSDDQNPDYRGSLERLYQQLLSDGILNAQSQVIIAKKQRDPAYHPFDTTIAAAQAAFVAAHSTVAKLIDLAFPTFMDGTHYTARSMRNLGTLEYRNFAGAVVAMPSNWTNLVFTDKAPDFVSDGAGNWRTTATGGSWGHGGKSDLTLAKYANGGVCLHYTGPNGVAGVLGLHDAAGRVGIQGLRYSFYIEPNGTLSVFYTAPGASTATSISSGSPAPYGYYWIGRFDGVLCILYSTDQATWSPAFFFPEAYDTDAKLYPMVDVNSGDPSFGLQQPQGAGLS